MDLKLDDTTEISSILYTATVTSRKRTSASKDATQEMIIAIKWVLWLRIPRTSDLGFLTDLFLHFSLFVTFIT
jgi:hypothetical protein